MNATHRLHDLPHRLVGNAELSGDGPQSLPLHPVRDLGPALAWNARCLNAGGIAPRSSPLPRPKHSIGIEERYKRRRHDVYLA